MRSRALDEPLASPVREDHGLSANVSIYLRLDKLDLAHGADLVVDCLRSLCAGGLAAAVLLFNGEKVVLRVAGGAATFSSTFGVWTPERLARFGLPMRLEALGSPALEPE